MRLGTALVCLCSIVIFGSFTPSQAQRKNIEKRIDPQDSHSDLTKDIKNLQQQQQQIIEELNDLKRVLSATAAPGLAPRLPDSLEIVGELFSGDSKAPVAIVEYADFECPFCGMYARQVYPQIDENYIKTGKVKFFYRDFPIPTHSHALSAARAARCAGEQGKYWEIHDNLFANQTALGLNDIFERAKKFGIDVQKLSECLSSEKYAEDIRKGMAEAQQLGVQATPTFFLGFIGSNGDAVSVEKRIVGAAPYEVFRTDLDALLAVKSEQTISSH